MRIKPRSLAIFVAVMTLKGVAEACGPCEYEDGILKICMPKGDCIIPPALVPPNPLTVIVTVADAIKSGNVSELKRTVGEVVMSSTAVCGFGCKYVTTTILPNATPEQLHSIAGEGFLTYLASGDPILVAIDVGANVAQAQKVGAPRTAPPVAASGAAPKPTPKRGTKKYTATAKCMSKWKGKNTVYAFWTDPAAFVGTDGSNHQFPTIDLLPGDILTVTSPKCPGFVDTASGGVSLETATFKYAKVDSQPGPAERLKWIIVGTMQPSHKAQSQ
jgi:hypothetical protein